METKNAQNVLVTCHKHWTAYVIPRIVAFLFIVGGISGFKDSIATGFGLIILALAIFGICYLVIHSEYISLSETDITGKKGVIKSTKLVTPIGKVQGVSISNGLFGKILGYHTITVTTAGTAGVEYVFTKIRNAKAFQEKYISIANQ